MKCDGLAGIPSIDCPTDADWMDRYFGAGTR